MRINTLALASCAFAFTCLITSQVAQAQSWAATDLGASTATALNASGQVVGYYTTAGGYRHAFATGANGVGFVDLGTLGGAESLANAINNAGQIVGWSTTAAGTSVAFATSIEAGGLTSLGTLYGTQSYAQAINNNGEVVINYSGTGSSGTAVMSLTTAEVRDVTPYGYSGHFYVTQRATANSINDQGTIVGSKVESCNCTANAYVFPSSDDFYFSVGSGVMDSSAYDVNNQNQIAGYLNTVTPGGGVYYRAAFAQLSSDNVTYLQDLGTLGGTSSFAYGLNNLGQVVGTAQTASGESRAFVTGPDGSGMTDINSLVTLSDGVYLTTARDINDLGQIIAQGSDGRSYLVSAVPEASTLSLGLIGGLGLVWRRQRHRVTT